MTTPGTKRADQTRLPGFVDPLTGFTLDLSGLPVGAAALQAVAGKADAPDSAFRKAHQGMLDIENGRVKNVDEGRQVTHFTDRLTYLEGDLYAAVESFARDIRAGARGEIDAVVMNGIGGSALGPQLVQFALNGPYWNELSREARRGYPRIYFLDNTDAAGVADVKQAVDLSETIVVTVSKSGGTQETVNNTRALEQAFARQSVDFASRAVAVTMVGSKLDAYARENGWRKIFPMAESIGGRTSETNIVGHVPAALTGIDFAALVEGAKAMDRITRAETLADNPAYQLALAWYLAGAGRGDRNMVVVPYSDRLVLLGKYLQQLVMESLGKELDLDGQIVHQGLTVYGNKGGTDAHAYIQQLNDGRNDFFATFIEVLQDAENVTVAGDLTMGDYLHAFKQGLMKALRSKGRLVIDIVIETLDAASLGMLIALYERAVAFYAELIHVNAFHQPGVQAYKLASNDVTGLHARLSAWIGGLQADWAGPAEDAAHAAQAADEVAEVAAMLSKFALNSRSFGGRGVSREYRNGAWHFRIA